MVSLGTDTTRFHEKKVNFGYLNICEPFLSLPHNHSNGWPNYCSDKCTIEGVEIDARF